MKRGLPKLERGVRERVLAEVRRSEILWREYTKRRWAIRLGKAFEVFGMLLAVPTITVGAVMVPASINMLSIGFGSFQSNDPAPIMHVRNGIEVAMFSQAMFLTGVTIMMASVLAKDLWQSHRLAVLAHLPVDDADLGDKRLRAGLWTSTGPIAFIASFGYAYWAWLDRFNAGGWAATAALVVLQGLAGSALMAWLQGRFTVVITVWLGALIVTAGLVAGSFGAVPNAGLEALIWVGTIFMPAGWISAAFQVGLVRHNPAGWLWLVPVSALLILARRRLKQRYVIREFLLQAHGGRRGQAEVLPEPCCAALKGPQFRLPFDRPAAKSDEPRLSETDAVRLIREGALMEGVAAGGLGWVERFLLRRLSTRERAVLDCMFVLPWSFWMWTWWWNCLALGTAVLLALLAGPWFTQIFRGGGPSVAALCIVIYVLYFCGPGITTGRAQTFPSNWLPVGDAEVSRLLWKLHLSATILVSPFFLIVGLAAGWRIYGQPMFGLLVSVIWLYTALVVFPFRLIVSIGTEAIDDSLVMRRMPLLMLLACAGTIVFAAVWGTLQWQEPWLSAVSAAVLPFLSFGTWYAYRRSLARWRGDWLPSR